ncbi:MAG: outer membrane beta-barrel protein [Kiloniellales bacterium]
MNRLEVSLERLRSARGAARRLLLCLGLASLGAVPGALASDDGLRSDATPYGSVPTPYLFPALSKGAQGGAQFAQASSPTQTNVAQRQIERGQTVRGRPRPDYDPQGLPVGGFTLFPQMVVAPLFDDNVFRSEDNTAADIVTVLSPSVNLESNWSRHALNFGAGADIGLYFDNDDENFEDYRFNADGRLDVTRDTVLRLSGGFAHLHQGRGDPDDPAGALEPTQYDRYNALLRASHRMGRFTGILSGGVTRLDYEDVPRRGGGPKINNDDRDNIRYDVSGQVNYEIVPSYDAFVRVGADWTDFDDSLDDAGFNRDNNGYVGVAGVEIDFGGIVFGDFFAGYMYNERDDSRLDNIDGFNLGADITWNVTRLTTITGTAEREIRNTTLGGSGSIATTVGLQVDHELLRNLIVSLNASGQQNDFEGDIDRTDYNIIGGISVDYFINRYFFVGALYEHRERLSSGDDEGGEFSVNIAGVRAGAQF